jgi:hypothetical protein
MKSMVHLAFTFLLTLSVLLGSVGVALSEQICLMTGLKQPAGQNLTDSCCQEPDSNAEEDSCCTEALSFEKLEPVSAQKAFHLEVPVFFNQPLNPLLLVLALVPGADQRLLTYSDSSPPLYGRQLLHQLHILIV